MGRTKTVSDDEVVRRVRALFLRRGHDLSVRELAAEVGLSTATLYQRFGSKDDLFFQALAPSGPDTSGWPDPEEATSGLVHLGQLCEAVASWLDETLPNVLRLMAHPAASERLLSGHHLSLHQQLVAQVSQRLERLAERGLLEVHGDLSLTARLLVSVAHDAAVAHALLGEGAGRDTRELSRRVELVWRGLAPGSGGG
ncbi:MAG: TetR/AcrR family transcriptional regulator [Myxococcales bacterium]|nr:TetR/AcrR family transcriptional regulator [Myxococcales bacterium]